jgi:DNA-binding XRE family transcriptional regulator
MRGFYRKPEAVRAAPRRSLRATAFQPASFAFETAQVLANNPLHVVKGVGERSEPGGCRASARPSARFSRLSARIPRSLRSLPPSQAKGAEYLRSLFGETAPPPLPVLDGIIWPSRLVDDASRRRVLPMACLSILSNYTVSIVVICASRGNLAMNRQGCVAFLPFARVFLNSLIPKPYDFVPISVGNDIRKRRLELGLLQKEAALRIGVSPWTVLNWEKGHTKPLYRPCRPFFSSLALTLFLSSDRFQSVS